MRRSGAPPLMLRRDRGKILDASFVAGPGPRESCSGSLAGHTTRGLTLYLPTLALTEVRVVCPDAGAELAELLSPGDPGTRRWPPRSSSC